MLPRAIRLSEETMKAVGDAAKQRGFTSASAFIRYAVEQELAGRREELTGTEERLVGKMEHVEREQLRLVRTLQALFAYMDTLTKTFLTCVPEPPADVKSQAVALAKERYDRLLKSAGRAMAGESKLAILDLVAHVEA
jgi:hypothetical protein